MANTKSCLGGILRARITLDRVRQVTHGRHHVINGMEKCCPYARYFGKNLGWAVVSNISLTR